MWGIDEKDRTWCREEVAKLRSEGIFTPPSVAGSLIVPGNIGGMAWGGAAYDREHDLLIIPTNRFVAQVRLIPRADFDKEASAGRAIGGDWEFAAQRGTPYGMARPTASVTKSWQLTASGCQHHSAPAFLKFPTSSLFLASTLMTGQPCCRNRSRCSWM